VTKAPSLVLVVNGGSSSIKFALFETDHELRRIVEGQIERIGQPNPQFHLTDLIDSGNSLSQAVKAANYQAAVEVLEDWMESKRRSLIAIGHRVVYGGTFYRSPQLISKEMLANLGLLVACDPDHLPGEIQLIEACSKKFPNTPQVACFDTSFHRDMPQVAKLMAIPRRYAEKGIERFGFHGISYEFLMGELTRIGDPAAIHGKVILAHLGNGASLAAIHNGKSIDTSMGFTPTSGIPMGTRSGDIDPGLISYLANSENMSLAQWDHLVNHESGLLGISETSSDMRDLLERETSDVRAAEAVALFCYQITKCIGAFAAALNGLDALVFSGGIGQHADVIRSRVCANLSFLGIHLDLQRNSVHSCLISSDASLVRVRVMATDEESVIARSVIKTLHFDTCQEITP